MTACEAIIPLCLWLLSIVLLSLSISTLVMSGQSIYAPNASPMYIFSAIIIGGASIMFVAAFASIIYMCKKEPESAHTLQMRAQSSSVKAFSCTTVLVFVVSIIAIALTSALLTPAYSNTKMPIWYTGSILAIALLTLIISTVDILNSSTCCVAKNATNDDETQTPSYLNVVAESGVQNSRQGDLTNTNGTSYSRV